MSLKTIAEAIRTCTDCGLCKRRDLAVPGEGPETAEIVLIGEGPGNEEDLQGKPFVGAAGQLLSRLLADAGIARGEVFVTNVVKCRPEDNREPTPQEASACRKHLKAQLEAIDPVVIVTLGKSAAQFVTGHYGPIQGLQEVPDLSTSLSGTSKPVVVAYHPSYLLRLLKGSQQDKERARNVYEDFQIRFRMALAYSRGERVGPFFGEDGIDVGDLL